MCAHPFRTHGRVRSHRSRAPGQYIKVGKECRQARFVKFVFGVVRQVRTSGCRDHWFDHSRCFLRVVRHIPVLRLGPPQAIPADPSTQVLGIPRAAPRQLHPVDWSGYQGTVLTPGLKASGIVPGQAPSSGPVFGDAENAIPDNGVWSINDQGEHVFRMRVPCLPDQLGEGSWRLGNDKRGAWLDLREEAADNGYVLARPPQCVPSRAWGWAVELLSLAALHSVWPAPRNCGKLGFRLSRTDGCQGVRRSEVHPLR